MRSSPYAAATAAEIEVQAESMVDSHRGEGLDYHGLREYLPGDPPRRIHWKVSARMDRLIVVGPAEDGMNVSSSRVEIRKALVLRVERTAERDRDLFDMETDDGASYVEIRRGCRVDIEGVLGDQLVLSSSDMRQPARRRKAPYRFNGVSRRKASLIYSIDED